MSAVALPFFNSCSTKTILDGISNDNLVRVFDFRRQPALDFKTSFCAAFIQLSFINQDIVVMQAYCPCCFSFWPSV